MRRAIQTYVGLLTMLLVASLASSLNAEETFKEKVTGQTFPTEVTFTRRGKLYNLEATGAAVRIKWFTKGYAIAHYMQDPIESTQEAVLMDVFSGDKAKQMIMIWKHRLNQQLIRDSFRESLAKALGPTQTVALKDKIDEFLGLFKNDAAEGDRHDLRWFPGGTIELLLNDKTQGDLVSPNLAKGLWDIWLGPDSVVDRGDMLQLVITK